MCMYMCMFQYLSCTKFLLCILIMLNQGEVKTCHDIFFSLLFKLYKYRRAPFSKYILRVYYVPNTTGTAVRL